MKKAILGIVSLILVSTCCSCGNMSMGIGNYEFKKIHVDTYHYSGCLTVEKWYDNSNGIEVLTEEAGSMYLAEGMYMLIEDECPFCGSTLEEDSDD